jgi:hypothetical protein
MAVAVAGAPKAILSSAVVSQRKRLTMLIGSAEAFFEKLIQRLWTKHHSSSHASEAAPASTLALADAGRYCAAPIGVGR